MEMRLVVVLILAMVMTSCRGLAADDQTPEAVEKWFEEHLHAEPKMTKLRFFLHNIFTGDGLTAARVAQANITSTSPTNFGAVYVMDAPLTVGPELDSGLVGYAKGLYIFTSLEEVGADAVLSFWFTRGEYKGSTLSFFGGRPVEEKYREYPIVGGSGYFRLARGIATVRTLSKDFATSENLQFDFIVLHY